MPIQSCETAPLYIQPSDWRAPLHLTLLRESSTVHSANQLESSIVHSALPHRRAPPSIQPSDRGAPQHVQPSSDRRATLGRRSAAAGASLSEVTTSSWSRSIGGRCEQLGRVDLLTGVTSTYGVGAASSSSFNRDRTLQQGSARRR